MTLNISHCQYSLFFFFYTAHSVWSIKECEEEVTTLMKLKRRREIKENDGETGSGVTMILWLIKSEIKSITSQKKELKLTDPKPNESSNLPLLTSPSLTCLVGYFISSNRRQSCRQHNENFIFLPCSQKQKTEMHYGSRRRRKVTSSDSRRGRNVSQHVGWRGKMAGFKHPTWNAIWVT